MRRKVICAFALIVWLLAACTLLSTAIDRWMAPRVSLADASRGARLSPEALLVGGDGAARLYQAEKGGWWEAGLRAREVSPENYTVGVSGVMLNLTMDDVKLIQYYSKAFADGDRVEPAAVEKTEDCWLVIWPEGGSPAEKFPEGVKVRGQAEAAFLLDLPGAKLPLMPRRAQKRLGIPSEEGLQPSLYSLTEVKRFFAALPFLALLPAGLPSVLALWACSCFLSRNAGRNRLFLLLNAGLGAVSLVAAALFLFRIDLPSSLLPPNYIFDFGHYAKEFREIFAALETFAAQGDQTAAAALQSMQASLTGSAAVLLGGALLAAVLIAVEAILLKRRARSSQRAGG